MASAIQNVTADLTILSREPSTDSRASRLVRELSIAHRVLHEQAAAIGVPADWIHLADKQGRLDRRTTGEPPTMPRATPVARPMVLAQLRHQVDALYTLPAIGVLRRQRGLIDDHRGERLSEHLRLQWLRVALTATAINATETEVRGWWDIDPSAWQPRLGAVAERLELEGGRAWRAVTQPAVLRDARCRVAVMRIVGITIADSPAHQLPPAPHLLDASAEHAWQTRDQIERPAGELIGTAIEVTGVTDTHGRDHADHSSHDLPPPALSANPVPELDL
ncbi:hypothetical protein [Nocardia sp. NPDC058497]|uniref:hypothetical protein n=1 Tax=Nocardia sp. NPDC058497 TaxID=3346529 RepID=UPI0036594529